MSLLYVWKQGETFITNILSYIIFMTNCINLTDITIDIHLFGLCEIGYISKKKIVKLVHWTFFFVEPLK